MFWKKYARLSARMIVNPVSMRMENDRIKEDECTDLRELLQRGAMTAMRIEKLNQTTKKNLLEDLLKRSPNSYEMYEEQCKGNLR